MRLKNNNTAEWPTEANWRCRCRESSKEQRKLRSSHPKKNRYKGEGWPKWKQKTKTNELRHNASETSMKTCQSVCFSRLFWLSAISIFVASRLRDETSVPRNFFIPFPRYQLHPFGHGIWTFGSEICLNGLDFHYGNFSFNGHIEFVINPAYFSHSTA